MGKEAGEEGRGVGLLGLIEGARGGGAEEEAMYRRPWRRS